MRIERVNNGIQCMRIQCILHLFEMRLWYFIHPAGLAALSSSIRRNGMNILIMATYHRFISDKALHTSSMPINALILAFRAGLNRAVANDSALLARTPPTI